MQQLGTQAIVAQPVPAKPRIDGRLGALAQRIRPDQPIKAIPLAQESRHALRELGRITHARHAGARELAR